MSRIYAILISVVMTGCSTPPAAPDVASNASSTIEPNSAPDLVERADADAGADDDNQPDISADTVSDMPTDLDPANLAERPDTGVANAAPDKPVGRLCIKGPGTHARVGKGSVPRDSEELSVRAAKVNAGATVKVGGKEVTVKGKQGGMIEGLDLDVRHRVSVKYTNGKGAGFSFRFEDGNEICAYYNGMYDNWRVRPVGRRACGPCEAN